MRSALLALLLISLGPADAPVQEIPSVDELLARIEARVAPIQSLRADLSVRGRPCYGTGVGGIELVCGRWLRRSVSLSESVAEWTLLEEAYTREKAGFRFTFDTAVSSLHLAGEADLTRGEILSTRGVADNYARWAGLDWMLLEANLFPSALKALYRNLRVEKREEAESRFFLLSGERDGIQRSAVATDEGDVARRCPHVCRAAIGSRIPRAEGDRRVPRAGPCRRD